MGGYTKMVANMLEGVEVRCGVDYKELAAAEPDIAARTITAAPSTRSTTLSWARSSTAACASRPETLDEQDHQGRGRGKLHRARDPLRASSSTKHFEFGAGQDRHHARVPGRLEARRRALLPHQRRQERGLYRQYEELAAQEGDVMLRRTPGRLQSTTTWTRPSPRPSSSSATSWAWTHRRKGAQRLETDNQIRETISPVQRCYTGLTC